MYRCYLRELYVLFANASLMHSVSIEKQESLLFGTLIGSSPAVALSESMFFTLFLRIASKTQLKEKFLFIQKFCFILRMLGEFEKLLVIPCILI